MDDEEKSQEEIKIVDKRRFSEEGESRENHASESSQDDTDGLNDKEASNLQGEPTSDGPPQTLDFSSFVIGLATQVLVMLGEVPDPESNLTKKNIEAARQTIDILVLLKEKTKGNLSEPEERLLTEVVSSMQMKFVQQLSDPIS